MSQTWTTHRDKRGCPRWYQRFLEAWWVVTGKWSLHRAWQVGKDQGGIDEWRRLIVNRAAITELEQHDRRFAAVHPGFSDQINRAEGVIGRTH